MTVDWISKVILSNSYVVLGSLSNLQDYIQLQVANGSDRLWLGHVVVSSSAVTGLAPWARSRSGVTLLRPQWRRGAREGWVRGQL